MSDGFFHMDDFFYLTDAQRDLWAYVSQIYNGHLMPLGFAIVWFSQAIAPMSWTLAIGVCAGFWALFLFGVVALMRRAFDSEAWTLIVTGILAFAPLLTTVTVWYASALQILPWAAALVWMLYFTIRDAQQSRLVWALSAVSVYVIGLLFWQKMILALPVVLWLAWRFWPGDGRLGLRRLGQRWVIPTATVAVTALYLLVYVRLQSESVLRSEPTPGQVFDALRISLGEVWLPAYFGAPWTGFGSGLVPGQTSAWWAVALVWQVVLALVIVSLVRWRHAWNAWLLLVGYALVTVALFASARIGAFGLVLAYDPRYVEDLFVVGALTLPFAFLRPRGSRLPEPRRLHWVSSDIGRPLAAVGALALANLLVLTSVAIGSSWHDSEARRYVETARASLQAEIGTPVLDRKVPSQVMADLFLERANASYVLGGLRLPIRWNESGPRVLSLGDDGSTREVLLAESSTSVPGLDGACAWRVVDIPTAIEMDTTLFDWVWIGRMEYLASGSGDGRVSMGGSSVRVPIQEGLNEVTFLVVGRGDTVMVTPPEGVGMCVAQVVIAQVDYGAQA
jgi:hypothetical protein